MKQTAFQLNKPQKCCGCHGDVSVTGLNVQDPRPPARLDTLHRGAEPLGTSPGSPSAAQKPSWRWPAPPPRSHTPAAAAIPAAPNTEWCLSGLQRDSCFLTLQHVCLCTCLLCIMSLRLVSAWTLTSTLSCWTALIESCRAAARSLLLAVSWTEKIQMWITTLHTGMFISYCTINMKTFTQTFL